MVIKVKILYQVLVFLNWKAKILIQILMLFLHIKIYRITSNTIEVVLEWANCFMK